MKTIVRAVAPAALTVALIAWSPGGHAQTMDPHAAKMQPASSDASPIYGVRIPTDYRRWEMIAVSQEVGLEEFRGIVGNASAIKAYRDGTLPFPDGAMLVKIAWKREPSSESEGAFVPGKPTTVQVMVKDARRYAASGGWGFGRFIGGMAVDEAQHRTCYACHVAKVKNHDIVFTRFAP